LHGLTDTSHIFARSSNNQTSNPNSLSPGGL
jgi:hypothetical protein